MNKKFGKIVLPLIIVLSILLVLVAMYFLVMPTFTILADESWNLCLDSSDRLGISISYALSFVRLKTQILDLALLQDASALSSYIQNIKSDYVLLTPVVSFAAIVNNVNVSALAPKTICLGMSSEGQGLFDVLLISEPKDAWVSAAKTVKSNFALLYDSSVTPWAQEIASSAPLKAVERYDAHDSTDTFNIDKLDLGLVLCPYVEKLYEYVDFDSPVSWVVDYRFYSAIEKKKIYAYIRPSFGQILTEARNTKKR